MLRSSGPKIAMLVPSIATLVFAFDAGGYFVDGPAIVAVALCLVLALRFAFAARPLEGLGPLGVIVLFAIGLFAVWTLASAAWSDAPARALTESNRAVMYALLFLLTTSVARTDERLRWLVAGLVAAFVAICAAAVLTRVLPGTFPSSTEGTRGRLSFPLTYWNALGLLGAVGVVLALQVAADVRQQLPLRVLAAAATPLLAVTIYFTLSRGAIGAAVIALVTFVWLGMSRGLAATLVACALPVAVTVTSAYSRSALVGDELTGAEAVGDGRYVAVVLLICMVVAGALQALASRIERRLPRPRRPDRSTTGIIVAGAVLALVLVGLIAGVPGRVDAQYRSFVEGTKLPRTADPRDRLTMIGNHGRLPIWRVAVDGFEEDPLKGQGAGTFETQWLQKRPEPDRVVHAHSLYLQVAAELGTVGLVLLATTLLAITCALVVRLRGPQRPLIAAFLACLLAWAVHAAVDWDWEVPAVTAWLFAAGGAAAAVRGDRAVRVHRTRVVVRAGGVLGAIALALTPWSIWRSQEHLDRAVASYLADDCDSSVRSALAAINALPVRPEPYEVLGYCNLRQDQPALAVRAMGEAIERDANLWEYRYGLSIAKALAGDDPRPDARRARALNPLEPLTTDLARRFRGRDPERWRTQAANAVVPLR